MNQKKGRSSGLDRHVFVREKARWKKKLFSRPIIPTKSCQSFLLVKIKKQQIRSLILHSFTCLECSEKYTGKTDPNIITCLHEHWSRIEKPLHIHPSSCTKFGDITNIKQLTDLNIPLLPLKTNEHFKYSLE